MRSRRLKGKATMSQPEELLSIKLTEAQRKLVAEMLPELAGRSRLSERHQRPIALSLAECRRIKEKAEAAIGQASGGRRNALRHLIAAVDQAIPRAGSLRAFPLAQRV